VTPARDDGSVVVETVLVMVLLIGLTLGIVQLLLVGHVRSVLSAVTAEGARQGSRSGASAQDGARYAQAAAQDAMGVATSCAAIQEEKAGGLLVVRVTCHSSVQASVFPVGRIEISASARAVREP
jgi:Flp pilus assembly protein TadG